MDGATKEEDLLCVCMFFDDHQMGKLAIEGIVMKWATVPVFYEFYTERWEGWGRYQLYQKKSKADDSRRTKKKTNETDFN